jgi:hypothetical protein
MKSKVFSFFAIAFVFAAARLQAQAFFAGAGPEASMNTIEGASFGEGFQAGYDFSPRMAAGLRLGGNGNFANTACFESAAFFRYYMPFLSGLFAEADIGASVFFADKRTVPAFLAGAGAGYRLKLGSLLYIEGFARAGYPFAWGVSLSAGLRFEKKSKSGL